MAASGEIPCRRLTGKLLFPRAEVEAWLAGTAPRPQTAMVVAGSHDPLLDWAIRESGSGLATFFDGSLDGLARVAAGEAAAAGLHVFEPERDEWNLGHVAQSLGASPVVLIAWARRLSGVLAAPGARIGELADLAGRRVVRRQASAGAGLLLGYRLAAAGVAVAYTDEIARTETEAAQAVASGAAEAAPGLEAMARPFGLSFLPLVEERFDLVIERRAYFEPPIQRLLGFARSAALEAKAAALGGYDLADHGAVRWNGP
jgi:putative molybdopterin biosynthesis protein